MSPGTCGDGCSRQPNSEIGVLVYSGLFLAEDAVAQKILMRTKLGPGCECESCSAIRKAHRLTERGRDEGVDDAIAAKIRNALVLYRPLRAIEGVEFRFHQTILYNSIYRGDDQLLVNTHVYGVPAFRRARLASAQGRGRGDHGHLPGKLRGDLGTAVSDPGK